MGLPAETSYEEMEGFSENPSQGSGEATSLKADKFPKTPTSPALNSKSSRTSTIRVSGKKMPLSHLQMQ